ncbi:ribokinase [Gluconobacter sphaericus NBRC 12467]|uniref:Ribokinase n=1 Tax=Gluconobacter sphaericus NBRC 12467 TaxID=1307951 RepID=A0AA37SF33_9PROT|nr:ribokinase [Gluconobacter sphaericus NBRC 12467]GEB42371.1 ribokinase [Gluconobacter sphaericus NBRC 12467]GLQ83884.1 ribokinase [Gluconobacter sphaericus NBRC 12467]
MRTPLILSFGSINIDLTARCQRLPRPGETVHADSYAIGLGGKGSNQAAAAARLAQAFDVDVALAGRVGCDAFGAQAQASLAGFGVDLSPLRDDADHPTGIALIGIDAAAENCITVAGGANMAVDETDIVAAAPWLDRAKVLLLQLEIPQSAVLAAARRTRSAGGLVVLDPAPAPEHGLPEALWSEIDILTPNESETFSLTGIRPTTVEEARKAAEILLAKGVRAVLVKMGAKGVFWHDGTGSGHLPPFRVVPIDTVAAGDCFNAGLAVALASGESLPDAARIASACGALATTRRGAADAAPEWNEVEALIRV